MIDKFILLTFSRHIMFNFFAEKINEDEIIFYFQEQAKTITINKKVWSYLGNFISLNNLEDFTHSQELDCLNDTNRAFDFVNEMNVPNNKNIQKLHKIFLVLIENWNNLIKETIYYIRENERLLNIKNNRKELESEYTEIARERFSEEIINNGGNIAFLQGEYFKEGMKSLASSALSNIKKESLKKTINSGIILNILTNKVMESQEDLIAEVMSFFESVNEELQKKLLKIYSI